MNILKLKDYTTYKFSIAGEDLQHIECEDNEDEIRLSNSLAEDVFPIIKYFAGMGYEQLQKDKKNGLIPLVNNSDRNIQSTDHLFDLKRIPNYRLQVSGQEESLSAENNPEYYELSTNNIMGVFNLYKEGVPVLRIQITSRFDDLPQQPFLCWMLQKVYSFDIVQPLASLEDNFWRILVELLFWQKLGEAREIGLYRQYQNCEYNDLRFKGHLDLDRHIRLNFPLWDKIAYSRREITFDNPINHLLRYAIQAIRSRWGDRPAYGVNQEDSLAMASSIEQETPTWRENGLIDLLGERDVLEEIRQPFFYDYYENLRKLALMVIDEIGAKLYDENDSDNGFEINGVVFDGADLWEDYLATILIQTNPPFLHPNNRTKTLPHYLYEHNEGTIYPDFITKDHSIILDAKYKPLDDKGFDSNEERDDRYQLISYLHTQKANAGYLLYPTNKTEEPEKPRTLNGFGGVIGAISLFVNRNKEYEEWRNRMIIAEEELKKTLKDVADEYCKKVLQN